MIHFESRHELPFAREAVWPVLSNTDWLNRALGLPAVNFEYKANPEGGSSVRARGRFAGFEITWNELPFEWLEPEFYRVRRVFDRGPVKEVRLETELLDLPGGGTQIRFAADIAPRNYLGQWLAERVLGPKIRRELCGIVAHAEGFLGGQQAIAFPRLAVQPVREPALQAGLEKIRRSGLPAERVDRLERLLRETPDVELSRIRPFAIARRWANDPWEILSLFLHATRSGLLDFRWEILCPNCRSPGQPPVSSLSRLERTSHCPACQIEFDGEFDKSVELAFAVNPAIRPRDDRTFCIAGPGGKPHVTTQLSIGPNAERPWKFPRLTQLMRLRSPQVKGSTILDPVKLGDARLEGVRVGATGFEIEYKSGVVEAGMTRVHNPNPFPVVLSLDELGWSDDILTASRVTNWQEFRDLFSSEVISPAEEVTVGSQVILFTDLRGSTAMYYGIGDAPAYALVRDHFGLLTNAVRRHHGAVVKTIGDAVMACFSRVDEALEAVREMHAELATAPTPPGLSSPLVLKSSLHVGPCLAVNANDRLDFFGTTVNLAARMVTFCHGRDLAVSDELFQRPETVEFLSSWPVPPERSEVWFRGFNSPHRVWKIPMV